MADNRLIPRRHSLPLLLLASASFLGCVQRWTRPEGDGGWDSPRRQEELAQRAAAAGVEFPTPGVTAQSAPTARVPLDLRSALALALRGNRRIAEAQEQLAIGAESVADARGRLLPGSIASGRYTWATDAQGNRFPAGLPLPAGAPQVIKIRDAEYGTLNATVTLPLDLSGELRHALAAAQAGYRGDKARLWATTLDQQTQVVRAYFQLLQAQRLREVTMQTLALDRQQVDNAEARFRNGRVTKNDLLIAQVALRNAEQRLVQRDLAIDQARWSLNQLLGLEVNAPTEVVDVEEAPELPQVGEALHTAYEHNPLLQALLQEQQRLDESEAALVSSRLPRFSAGGAGDYSTSDLLQPQQIGSAFAAFTWDLGTDTRREAQIAQARSAIQENRLVIEGQMRQLEESVRSTHRAAMERLSALSAAREAVGQAEENLRIRQQQFDAGRAQSDDVLRAEAVLAQQRATLASALYQAHTRRAELQQLVGVALEDLLDSQR